MLGAKWRIGDGTSTRIFKDNWLLDENGGRVFSSVSHLHENSTVDLDTKWWNVNLIDQIFLPFEAQKIKSIPLCVTPQEDILFWPKSSNGLYSVKSGYNLLCDEDSRDMASSSDSDASKNFWTRLWPLKVPKKVKSFLWRACTDSLPTLKNLLKRKVVSSSLCSLCQSETESILHALWNCEKIKSVWTWVFRDLPFEFFGLQNFADLLKCFNHSSFSSELFAMICW